MKQKATHIIKSDRTWKEMWSGPNGPAEVTCGKTFFLCGHKWNWVRFPDDPVESGKSINFPPICKKCTKLRAKGKQDDV